MTPSKLRTLVRRLGTRAVASRAGVHPSTVRRWVTKGKAPESRLPALQSLAGTKTPSKRDSARLLKLTPEALAARFGVTKRTARGWQKRGDIPRARLQVERAEPAPAPRAKARAYVGEHTQGEEYTVQGAGLDISKSLLDSAMSAFSSVRKGRGPLTTYQIVMVGKSMLSDEDPTNPNRYQQSVLDVEGEITTFETVVAGNQFSDYAKAEASFMRKALTLVNTWFTVDSIALYARRPLRIKHKGSK